MCTRSMIVHDRRAPTSSRRIASTVPKRRFSSSSEAAKPSPPPAAAAPAPAPAAEKTGGSSFLQRVAAFLTGAGVGCGVGYYHLAAVSGWERGRSLARLCLVTADTPSLVHLGSTRAGWDR